ncbi:MAG: hypothetical protein HYU32_01865 [candidate division NC10 bacterium]|nr:hypothetical protein [candidate division NC10 bacterium]
MSLSWIDISLLTLLICLAAVLMAHSLMYLNRREPRKSDRTARPPAGAMNG